MAGVAGRSGRRPVFDRQYQLQNMSQIHHEIVRLLLLGWGNKEIAEHFGVTEAMVCYTANSRIVQDKLAMLRQVRDAEAIDVAQRIKELAPECIDTLDEIRRNDNAGFAIRAKVSMDLLDRAGYAAPKVIRAEGVVAHLTMDDIAEIKRRAITQGIESGVIIDAVAECA
jgi:hypothetical protein